MTSLKPNSLVLIVEDDVLQRILTSALFQDAGYRVLEAESADEALLLFGENSDIALLFTDVSLPGSINGIELARHVSAHWPKVGVIMVSGRPRPDPFPLNMRFYAKPYEAAAVLLQAKAMTSLLH